MGRSYTSKPKDVQPFTLDGVEFRASGGLSILDVTELARYAGKDMFSPEGLTAIGEFFASLLGADYDRFREHCRTHSTDEETLLQVIGDIIEDVGGGHPSQRPSHSPYGPTTTGRGARVVSLSNRSVVELPDLTPEQQEQYAADAEELDPTG